MRLNYQRSALIIVDVQNDFCPGGALGIEKGDEVIEPLNRLTSLFAAKGGGIAATQDWHPPNHTSFDIWPSHCVQGTAGAEFHDGLDLRQVSLILRKGYRKDIDSYSTFIENDRETLTGLDGFLKALSIDTLVFGGLATDYCVLYSALDAMALEYKTIVAVDAIRGVGKPTGSIERALRLLDEAGVVIVESGDIQ